MILLLYKYQKKKKLQLQSYIDDNFSLKNKKKMIKSLTKLSRMRKKNFFILINNEKLKNFVT